MLFCFLQLAKLNKREWRPWEFPRGTTFCPIIFYKLIILLWVTLSLSLLVIPILSRGKFLSESLIISLKFTNVRTHSGIATSIGNPITFNEEEFLQLYDQEHPKVPIPDEVKLDEDNDFDLEEEALPNEEEEEEGEEGDDDEKKKVEGTGGDDEE